MTRRPAAGRALLALAAIGLVAAGTGALASSGKTTPDEGTPARTVPFALVDDREVADRLPRPEDRYAMAGGCYTLQAPGAGFVARSDDGLVLTPDAGNALPLHFQATRLGEYLLATNEGRDTRYEGAWWDVRGYLGADPALVPSDGVVVADEPAPSAEWRVEESDGSGYAFSVPGEEAVLTVVDGGLRLAPAATATATPLSLRHVPDDDPSDDDPNGTACATWPEIETGASGEPEPVAKGKADEARGFFEAHVHGMAFEFLGGELRCGRPWHPYGVEYALGSCYEENNYFNGVLEVPLGGYGPETVATYDPVGWPTFTSWPKNRTLTHEQFYWRWLERAYAGGLRLMTTLLVDNTALCQQFPVKKNSCNEMDSVRLQAQRLFELQDYVDAQSGGPGEGWLRIVTTPTQAREVINSGRLAVVLGIEISALFDCSEFLDVPQCTKEQIDERLQEVFDMGVRQMELVNKFDNALTGVKGDPGSTGVIVNAGNKYVTGHFWDMQTCVAEADDGHGHGADRTYSGDAHDHTQLSPTDATPAQAEGVDALAGRVLDQFGTVARTAVPLYGPGPHCNSRGLTELGEHLIRAMVDKGMFFDPDHMSAEAQRQALDLIETELARAEQADAADDGRPARQASVISSHSWSNDVTYQRIYALDGVVAPYAGAADSFAQAWKQLRGWAGEQASPDYDFGMGYGADTNGLGGQPPPRKEPARSLSYEQPFEAPIGGVTLTQQTSGLRTFDVTKEGVAMYGLFADWYQEVALAADQFAPELGGGEAILDDMLDGAETYLSLWERAVYGGGDCVNDGSTLQVEDLHAAIGLNLEGFLTAIGQPVDREGSAYVYCVEGQSGEEPEQVEVVFDDDGNAETVTPVAPAPPAAPREAAAPASSTAAAAADTAVDAAAAPTASHTHDGLTHAEAHADDVAGEQLQQRVTPASSSSSQAAVAAGALVLLAAASLVAHAVVDRRRTARA